MKSITTGELIELLRGIDPEGTSYIRTANGTAIGAIKLPGYYDGHYSYIDDDNNFHITKEGYKVHIYTTDLESFIWSNDGDTSKIILDDNIDNKTFLDMYDISRKAKTFIKNLKNENIVNVLERYKDGWMVAQSSKDKIGMCNVHWWYKRNEEISKSKEKTQLTQGESIAIVESGFFHHIYDKEYIVWELSL